MATSGTVTERQVELIQKLIDKQEPKEVVLANNATVEGQTTAHYITERLKKLGVATSRLAHGVPVGGELDYLDEGTLAAAIRSRTSMTRWSSTGPMAQSLRSERNGGSPRRGINMHRPAMSRPTGTPASRAAQEVKYAHQGCPPAEPAVAWRY